MATPDAARPRRRPVVVAVALLACALLALACAHTAAADGATWRRVALPQGQLGLLAVAPSHPNTLYASFGATWGLLGGDVMRFVRSDDGGQTWIDLGAGLKNARGLSPTWVVVAPNNPKRVYVGASDGVYLSTNGGASWKAMNRGLPFAERAVTALAISSSSPRVMYVATPPQPALGKNGRVFRSTDGGLNWRPANAGITIDDPPNGGAITAIAVAPDDPNTAYLSTSGPGGIFQTANGGARWTAGQPDGVSPGSDMSLREGRILALAVSPAAPNVVSMLIDARIARSADRGATWAIDPAAEAIDSANVLVADPHSASILYAGGPPSGLMISDGASTWSAVPGVPTNIAVSDIFVSRSGAPVMYAGGTIAQTGRYALYRSGDLPPRAKPVARRCAPGSARRIRVPAPTVQVRIEGASLLISMTARLSKAASGRTAQIRYLDGRTWKIFAPVEVPPSGLIATGARAPRALLAALGPRPLRLRITLTKTGCAPAVSGAVRTLRLPAR